MEPVIYIGIALAGWLIFDKFQTVGTAERLNYVISSAHWEFELLQVTVDIYVGIQNPTSNTLSFKSLVGTLYLNGMYVANVSSFDSKNILPNAQTTVKVTAVLSTLSLASDLIGYIQNPSGVITSVKGTINIDSLNVPVDLSYNVL